MNMKRYIGVKIVEARPINRGDYNTYRGWSIMADEDPDDAGYLVKYPDGYESWCPKNTFDEANKEIGDMAKNAAIKLVPILFK